MIVTPEATSMRETTSFMKIQHSKIYVSKMFASLEMGTDKEHNGLPNLCSVVGRHSSLLSLRSVYIQ